MSNSNQRPWYKDPRIVIPAIVGILVALIGGIFLLISSPQLPTGTLFKEIGGDTDTDGDYEISWESSERAIKYILQEDRDSSFTSPRTVYTGSETKQHIYGKSDGGYYYRVRACNKVGETEWSPIRKMTVVISPSLTPTQKPSVTPTPTSTSTPIVATPTPTPTSTPIVATPTPTPTPTPIVATPTPTPTPMTFIFDTNNDGIADAWDLNFDGHVDAWDFNFDSYADAWDLNFDGYGYADAWDLNFDGYADAWDTDYDGVADTWL